MLEKIKIKHVIIGKQYEENSNFNEFMKIINDKRIDVSLVEGGQNINIERNLYFSVLWPIDKNEINNNLINNNALVLKLNYKNFSMLFTGDIEKEAEDTIVEKYKETNLLKSNILKVGHHGSKTSSTEKFLNLVMPQIALIGVGKNNTFGHPNEEVITRLENMKCKIYRTDEDGEIKIKINKNGYKIKTCM